MAAVVTLAATVHVGKVGGFSGAAETVAATQVAVTGAAVACLGLGLEACLGLEADLQAQRPLGPRSSFYFFCGWSTCRAGKPHLQGRISH